MTIRLKASPATLAFCHLVMAVAARIDRDEAAQKEMPAEGASKPRPRKEDDKKGALSDDALQQLWGAKGPDKKPPRRRKKR